MDVHICPRCKARKLKEPPTHNALSRRDNLTYICDECGVEEAMVDFLTGTGREKDIPPEVQAREQEMARNG